MARTLLGRESVFLVNTIQEFYVSQNEYFPRCSHNVGTKMEKVSEIEFGDGL